MGRPRKIRNYEFKIIYPHIYLIGVGGSKGAEFRVTERPKGDATRPMTLRFTGRRPDPETVGETMGVMVIDDKLFETTFAGKTLMPNMATAEKAAKWMVENNEDVYFGCPICGFRTKKYEEYQTHIADKGRWILGQFEIEVSEVENGDKNECK